MSGVVDLAAWRLRRRSEALTPAAPLKAAVDEAGARDNPAVDRLDRAVQRLHALVSGGLAGRARLAPGVETELLAIMGELTVGMISEAADRAERLADRLAQ
jgi:hypothetical protein